MKILNKFKKYLFTFVFAVFGFVMLSSVSVNAGSFSFTNNQTSSVTYNESQILEDSAKYVMINYDNAGKYQVTTIGKFSYANNIFTNCSYSAVDSSSGRLSCTARYLYTPTTTGYMYATTLNSNSYFLILSDSVRQYSENSGFPSLSATYTILSAGYTEEDLENSYDEGYRVGENAGLETGYNNGYSAGESAGLTAGYNNGYNTGYSAGESAGYNTGYSAGESAGYNTGYSAGESAGYNTGYSAGVNDSTNFGINVSSCVVSGLVNNSTYNCNDLLSFTAGSFDFSSIRSYLDNNELISGRYDITLTLAESISFNDLVVSGLASSNIGSYVSFYSNVSLLYSYDLTNDFTWVYLDGVLSGGYVRRIVISSANYDNSVLSLTFYDSMTFDEVYDSVYDYAYENGYHMGSAEGYESGYSRGYIVGADSKNNIIGIVGAIFTGPVTMLTAIFDFEFLGINLSGLILSLTTLLVVIWLVKRFI